MAEATAIEWCDHTYNPWIGCTKISPGCDHCYAAHLMDTRHHRVTWGGDRSRTGEDTRAAALRWQRAAPAFYAKHGRRQRVFCSSLADVFDNHKSVLPVWRADLAETIRATPDLEWLLLTKRIGNVVDMLIEMFPNGVPDNVRIGATIVNQNEWDRDHRKIAAAMVATQLKPFLSMEPLLGAVDLERCLGWHRWIGWVIVGGESGGGARPMHREWARGLRDQCARRQVPFLFKQWGEWKPLAAEDGGFWPSDEGGCIRLTVDGGRDQAGWPMQRVGKKSAGRSLDDVTHTEFPR